MRNMQTPFQLHFQSGAGDLYEIVNDMARDIVIKSSRRELACRRMKKTSELVQVVS